MKKANIYDVLNKKMLADDWLVVDEIHFERIKILQDPSTGKYHLFCKENFRTPLNIFEEEFDKIKFLFIKNKVFLQDQDVLFAVSMNGKKGLYSCKNGWVKSCEYDDIEQIGLLTIFTHGKNKFFFHVEYVHYQKKEIISPIYDEIKCDKKDGRLIYCKKDSTITIYHVDELYYKAFYSCKALFNVSGCDDIKLYADECEGRFERQLDVYYFLLKKNNKFGLLCGARYREEDLDQSTSKMLLDIEYDAIEIKDGDFYFTKDGKLGLITGSREDRGFIPPKYDKIKRIINRTYYEVYNGEDCSIFNVREGKMAVNSCKIIKYEEYANILIYEKDGKKGMLRTNYIPNHLALLSDCDDIIEVGNHCYLVIKDGEMSLFCRGEKIIILNYESFEINGYSYLDIKNQDDLEKMQWHTLYGDILYMALKISEGTYDIAKFDIFGKAPLKFWKQVRFNYVKFFSSIAVLKDQNNTFVYNYSGKLLKTFPVDAQISATTMGDNCYLVDDEYYIYISEKFQKAYFEDVDLYATAYESEFGTVVVNSRDKEEHDRVCAEIEEFDDQTFDDTLISLYKQNPSVQEKYPTLVKKL